ncbi:MAG: hypothetical protein PGMFKBFP_02346 [Anaerolineales bacterium]|nr:hypothetical protein [Anaerolineales bacterium]
MRPLLDHLSAFDHHDAVGVGDGGQAVRDDERSAPLKQRRQRALDDLLGLRVHAGGGLVEDQNAGIGQ